MKTSNLILSALLITASSQAFASDLVEEEIGNLTSSLRQSSFGNTIDQTPQDVQDALDKSGKKLNDLLDSVATAPSNNASSANKGEQDVDQLAGNLSKMSIGANAGASGNTSGGNVDAGIKVDDNKPTVTPAHNQSTADQPATDSKKVPNKSSAGQKEKPNQPSKSKKNKISRKSSFSDDKTKTSVEDNKKTSTTSSTSSHDTVNPVLQPVNSNQVSSGSHSTTPKPTSTPTNSTGHPHAGNAASSGSIVHPQSGHDHVQQSGHDVKRESHDKSVHEAHPDSKKKNV